MAITTTNRKPNTYLGSCRVSPKYSQHILIAKGSEKPNAETPLSRAESHDVLGGSNTPTISKLLCACVEPSVPPSQCHISAFHLHQHCQGSPFTPVLYHHRASLQCLDRPKTRDNLLFRPVSPLFDRKLFNSVRIVVTCRQRQFLRQVEEEFGLLDD